MTALLLGNFSNRIASNLLEDIFKSLTTVTFNANTGVVSADDFIQFSNANNTFKNGDTVLYYTDAGNTVVTGLTNNTIYYITSANSSGAKLSATANGAALTINATTISETGHYVAQQNSVYYFAASKHTPWTDDNSPDTPYDNLNSIYDFQREMVFGKKINRSDLAFMIRKVQWASNTVYDHYDDTFTNIYDTDYFVINSSNNIYKCIDNNNGAISNTEPTHTTANTFSTADGYTWKYMYTLSSANAAKFATSNYIPVDANVAVSAAAVNGSIEFVQVETTGNGYVGYATGIVQQVVSNSIFKVETSSTSTANGFYNTGAFYIDGGTGAGKVATVSDYVTNATGHYIITSSVLTANSTTPLDLTSTYKLLPRIQISGDGTGAIAVPSVNTTSNAYSIDGVQILNKGSNYSFANATIVANSAHGSGATLRVVMSPEGGHGYNQAAELGSQHICISVPFANNENNTISDKIKYRKVGVVYNPTKFANAQQSYTSNTYNSLYKLNVTTGTITFANNEFITGLTSNAHGYIAYSNSTYMEITTRDGTFANGETIIGSNTSATAQITGINNPDITKFSGSVLYYDYISPISRANNRTEVAKLIIKI